MMDERERLWHDAVKFHGHSCPGLAIGVRVALDCREAMGLSSRAADEELVAVAETDACGVDGLQVILGCTAGKGNLWLRRRGKHVFTIYQRGAGSGLRYSWKSYGPELEREARTRAFLEAPKEELYTVEAARYPLPEKAAIHPSAFCAICGEHTAEPCLRVRGGQAVCLDCAGEPFDFSRRIILFATPLYTPILPVTFDPSKQPIRPFFYSIQHRAVILRLRAGFFCGKILRNQVLELQ